MNRVRSRFKKSGQYPVQLLYKTKPNSETPKPLFTRLRCFIFSCNHASGCCAARLMPSLFPSYTALPVQTSTEVTPPTVFFFASQIRAESSYAIFSFLRLFCFREFGHRSVSVSSRMALQMRRLFLTSSLPNNSRLSSTMVILLARIFWLRKKRFLETRTFFFQCLSVDDRKLLTSFKTFKS